MTVADLGLLLLVMLIWGLNFPIAKLGLVELPPLLLMCLRFALVAVLLVPFVEVPRRSLGRILLLAVTLGGVHFPLMFWALNHIDAATASIAIQLQAPFAALLAAIFLGDRLGPRRALGMAIAFGGVMIIAGEPRMEGGLAPLLMIVAASFVWAVANLQIKGIGAIDGFALNGWLSLFAAPQLLVATLLVERGQWQRLRDAGLIGYGTVVYMGVMVMIVGYGLWFPLVRRYDVNQTMPYTLLVPVFGVLSSVLILHEPLTPGLVVGGLLTVVGMAVITLRRPRLRAAASANLT